MGVILLGSLIALALFPVPVFYLRFFFRAKLFPETFLILRGLVTIVLFYKIPTVMKYGAFDDDDLSFLIFATGIIMAIGRILYKRGK